MKKYCQLQAILRYPAILLCTLMASNVNADSSSCSNYVCDYTAKEVSWPRLPLQTTQLIPLLFDNFSFKLDSNIKLVGVVEGDLILRLDNGNQVTLKKVSKKHYPSFEQSRLSASDIPKFMFEVAQSSVLEEDPLYRDKMVLYKMSRQVDFKHPDQVVMTRKDNFVAYIIKDIEERFIKSCWIVNLNNPNWFLVIEAENPADDTINYLLSNLSIN